jgi:HAD superfamily phosphatase (TIGR01681 family)
MQEPLSSVCLTDTKKKSLKERMTQVSCGKPLPFLTLKLDVVPALPKCFVFDLDDTLWCNDVDCTRGPPFFFDSKCNRSNNHLKTVQILDVMYDQNPSTIIKSKENCFRKYKKQEPALSLFQDVPAIFSYLYSMKNQIKVCIASRTTRAQWAEEALKGFHTISPHDKNTLISFREIITLAECYPRTKQKHLTAICKKLNINLKDIIFYDNLYENIEDVRNMNSNEKIGAVCVYTPNGLNWENFMKGLTLYQQQLQN